MTLKNIGSVLLFALLPSLLIFIVISIKYETPLIFDDYRYLYYSIAPDFSLRSLNEFVSRAPFFSVVLYALLKLDFLRSNLWFFLNFFFCVHVLSVGLITLYLIKVTKVPINFERKHDIVLVGVIISILSFYPNFIELTSWPSSTVYFLGGIFLALGLFSQKIFYRIIYFIISFGFYETYILPAFALILIPYFIDFSNPFIFTKIDIKKAGKEILTIIASFILLVILRYALSLYFGKVVIGASFPTWENFLRILNYLTTLMYHSSNNENLLEWIIIGSLATLIIYKKKTYALPLIILLLFILASSLHDLIVPYPGMRVVYGSFLIRSAFIAILIYLFFKEFNSRIIVWFFCIALFCAYFPSYIRTFKMRTDNKKVMTRKMDIIANLERKLEFKEAAMIEGITIGMHSEDWVTEDTSRLVLQLFLNEIGIDKKLKLFFQGQDVFSKEFPRYYPCASMRRNAGTTWKEENCISGEALYANPETPTGVLMYGPYISLDSGRYTIEVNLKAPNAKKEEPSGGFDICCNLGSEILFRKDFTGLDFEDNRNFKKFIFELNCSQKKEQVEFRGLYMGTGNIYFDYIKINKKL